jgi:Spy/CpxP family protein refolding chaperone
VIARRARVSVAIAALALAACAKNEAPPLPGDSVGADGAVALSPTRFSTVPAVHETDTKQALGPIESKLFAPEVVMEHQAAIGVTPAQKDAILKEVQQGQAAMLHMQWDLNGDKEKLVALLDTDKIDEAKASAQAAKLMADEDRIKAAHLTMLIHVKNVLSAEQQKKLRALRDEGRGAPDASASVAPASVPDR